MFFATRAPLVLRRGVRLVDAKQGAVTAGGSTTILMPANRFDVLVLAITAAGEEDPQLAPSIADFTSISTQTSSGRPRMRMSWCVNPGASKVLTLNSTTRNAAYQLLAFVGVQVLQVGLGLLARALLVDHLVDHADRVLGQDGGLGVDDLVVTVELVLDQRHLALEGDQRVADLALREGRRRAASAALTLMWTPASGSREPFSRTVPRSSPASPLGTRPMAGSSAGPGEAAAAPRPPASAAQARKRALLAAEQRARNANLRQVIALRLIDAVVLAVAVPQDVAALEARRQHAHRSKAVNRQPRQGLPHP
mgnify:CR=1 FL=1